MSDDAERLRAGLMLALAQQALGREVRIFLQMDAAALLAPPISAPKDARYQQAGLPSLVALIEEALDGGLPIFACQSGLEIAEINAASIDPHIIISGLVSFMAGVTGQDQLLTV
ncbi:MAG: peroxiredoxin [Sphingobium sp.]|nr:peroxiredoxin [Sphingobium sp.]